MAVPSRNCEMSVWRLVCGSEAYAESNLELEETHAEKKAKNDADACSKILGDIVSVVDAHRNQHPATGLEKYCCPLYHKSAFLQESTLPEHTTTALYPSKNPFLAISCPSLNMTPIIRAGNKE